MRRHPFVSGLVLVYGLAQAQGGVHLFHADSRALTASEAAKIKSTHGGVRALGAVSINSDAIESTVIDVSIEGKTHRFSGKKQELSNSSLWVGKAPDGGTAHLERSTTGIGALLSVGGKRYYLLKPEGRSILVEAYLPPDALEQRSDQVP